MFFQALKDYYVNVRTEKLSLTEDLSSQPTEMYGNNSTMFSSLGRHLGLPYLVKFSYKLLSFSSITTSDRDKKIDNS